MPRKKQSGRYPDWLALAMIKAGASLNHAPVGRILARHPSETNLKVAKARMTRAVRMAEIQACKARIRAAIIVKNKGCDCDD